MQFKIEKTDGQFLFGQFTNSLGEIINDFSMKVVGHELDKFIVEELGSSTQYLMKVDYTSAPNVFKVESVEERYPEPEDPDEPETPEDPDEPTPDPDDPENPDNPDNPTPDPDDNQE